jgi:hypothetical protein
VPQPTTLPRETIGKDNKSELPDIGLQLSEYLNQSLHKQLQRFAARSTCSQENDGTSANCEVYPKTKCENQAQRRYRTELEVDPLFNPPIHAFCKQFCETRCLRKGNVPSAAKCMAGTAIPT